MQHQLRREDRAISQEQSLRVLEQGEYGVLSTVSPEGQPYGIPLNYCFLDGAIYFHSALAGHKLDNLAGNPRVCFCVVGNTQVLPDKFATLYESVVVFGGAAEVTGAEKQVALEGLLDKYSAGFRSQGLEYIAKLGDRARVCKITIEAISGKGRAA